MTLGVLVKCPKCTYTWQPRVAKPKACPRCKRRLDAERRAS